MSGLSYKDAGVDIDAGNSLVERIKPLAKATARAGVMGGLGGFGAVFDLKATGYRDPLLISSTDGVGTKLKLAIETGLHDHIGIDLVAMCVNDLVVQGAEPLFFLDYFATGTLAVDTAARVISGIAEGCRQAGCALVGGETAEMPGLYRAGEYDLAGFSVGAVERDRLLPLPNMQAGDVLIGIASSGVHSNGYSLVRKIIERAEINLTKPSDFDPGRSWQEVWLTPTRIYVPSCLALLKALPVKGFAHITGGGITENVPRVLPEHLSARIDTASWQVPSAFSWLARAGGVAMDEMRRTFNMGIGMVAVVQERDAAHAIEILTGAGETAWLLGELVPAQSERVIYA